MNYQAIGYNVTDEAITENGKVEIYVDRADFAEAVASWLYTHKLHDGNATIGRLGCGYCSKCGHFAVVVIKEDRHG